MASFNIQKITGKGSSGSVAAIMRHNDTELRKTTNHSNADIDITQSDRNIEMCSYADSFRRHKDRIEYLDTHKPVKGKINTRSDRCECLLWECPAPEGLDPNSRDDCQVFFDACKDWLEQKYGKDNITGIWLHVDEIHNYKDNSTGEDKTSRMHVHCTFVPEKEGRLCCKEVFSRKTLSRDQRSLDGFIRQRCRDRLHKDVLFLTGENINRGETVEQRKTEAAKGRIKALEAEREELSKTAKTLEQNVESMRKDTQDLQAEYDKATDEYYEIDERLHKLDMDILKFKHNAGLTDDVLETLYDFADNVTEDIQAAQKYHEMAEAIIDQSCQLRDRGEYIVFADGSGNEVGQIGKTDLIKMLGLNFSSQELERFFTARDILREGSLVIDDWERD